jgi:predicted  nucleic acid-binding Zn-ribbon protein
MAAQAQVTSVEALEHFRSDVILFLSQMQPVIDEIGGEVMRVRLWLQGEQKVFWETELRKRRRKLEEAQAELFNARLSLMQDSTILPQMSLQKAQRAVTEAEQKIVALKKWSRDLEKIAEPLLKQVEQLRGFLTADLNRAVIELAEIIRKLDEYAKTVSPVAATETKPHL